MPRTDPWLQELERERAMKNEFMARHPESPFVLGRVPFHDLVYFPPDPAFRVRARLERLESPAEAYLRTNRDNQAVMRYLGDLSFEISGESCRLRVYHAGEGVGRSVFVPFRDRTSGAETYSDGRYLTLELNEEDLYELDFNRAFNPYCAYTDDYECSYPPSDNTLAVRVTAGERQWAAGEPVQKDAIVRVRAASAPATRARRPPAATSRAGRPRRRPPAKGAAAPKRSR